jgi:branched-chain amino acid transport system ATP-binding protein
MTAAALSVCDARLSFGGVVALEDVGFDVAAGDVLAVVGSNGSGKTSLFNCISGLYPLDSGEILLHDERIDRLGAHAVARLGVARTFQHVELPRHLSVLEVTMLGCDVGRADAGLIATGLGVPFRRGTERAHRRAAAEMLERVGLHAAAREPLGALPYGLAKRVDIARALVNRPRILLLDEPAAGLNDDERSELVSLVGGIAAGGDVTVLLIEHDMHLVASTCPSLVVLSQGRLVFAGDTRRGLLDPEVAATFLGRSVAGELAAGFAGNGQAPP